MDQIRLVGWQSSGGSSRFRYVEFAAASLCRRERDRADADEQKEVKRAPDEVRFGSGGTLCFHSRGVVLVGVL